MQCTNTFVTREKCFIFIFVFFLEVKYFLLSFLCVCMCNKSDLETALSSYNLFFLFIDQITGAFLKHDWVYEYF